MADASVEMSKSAMVADPDDPYTHQNCRKNEKVMTFHLYDSVAASLLKGISLSPIQLNTDVDVEASDVSSISLPENEVYTVSTKKTCLLCSNDFSSRQQQTDHYKLDWHRFNLKQRMIGAQAVSEEHFENISGDVSSISGSDSSTDDDSDNDSDLSPYSKTGSNAPDSSNQSDKRKGSDCHVKGRRHLKVFFRNGEGQLVSVQQCILHGKKNAPTTQQELVTMATQLPERLKWLILMIGGGHFAGAIFEGKEVTAHKTFHRYTVRAKRGTAQGMRDSQQGGNQPKSAGASLRRYNEAALIEDIHTLLASWDAKIKACHRIFLRAPSYNKNAFFGGKNPPLDRRDERIVTIPFAMRRPTYKEIKRVQDLLSTMECHGDAAEAEMRILGEHLPKVNRPKNGAEPKTAAGGNVGSLKPVKDTESTQETTSDGVAESEDDIDWVLVEEEVSTLELKEFETNVTKSKRPKKKRKPKKKPESNEEQAKPNSSADALREACRAGHWDQLKALMIELKNGDPETSGREEKTEPIDCEEPGQTLAAEDSFKTIEEHNTQPEVVIKGSFENANMQQNASAAEENEVDSSGKEDVISNAPKVVVKSQERLSSSKTHQKFQCENQTDGEANGAGLPGNEQSILGNQPQGIMGSREDLSSVVNLPVDELGNTLLHVAAQAERPTVLWNLMESGADPAIKNKKGQLAYVLCNIKEMRKEFRRFMAAHPEKYNYERAQIPSPLTSNKEEIKAAKAAEKRRIQKKNKRVREKEQKEEQKRQEDERRKREAEEDEKRRFASLSDREKRALAAERRYQAQLAAQTTMLSNTQRCWLCGTSLVSMVPFEYFDYKFCTIQCVKQQHKTSTT